MRLDPGGVRRGAEAEMGREPEGEAQAHCDRLAVDEARGVVTGDPLQGVREGMAEVEQRPVAVLALVAHHHGRLGAAALRHRVVALGPAREHPAPAGLAPGEERLVVDEPVLGDLGIARAHLAHG